MAFKIMPITDVNAITFHYLQCINNKLKMEADSKKVCYYVAKTRSFLNHSPLFVGTSLPTFLIMKK